MRHLFRWIYGPRRGLSGRYLAWELERRARKVDGDMTNGG
jgi:hypothetical protein